MLEYETLCVETGKSALPFLGRVYFDVASGRSSWVLEVESLSGVQVVGSGTCDSVEDGQAAIIETIRDVKSSMKGALQP